MLIYVDIDETICYYSEPLKDYNYEKAEPEMEDTHIEVRW